MPPMPTQQEPALKVRRGPSADMLLHGLAFSAALIVFGMLIALLIVLVRGAMPSIKQFGGHFLTTSAWREQPTVDRDPVTHKFKRDTNNKIVKLPGNTY